MLLAIYRYARPAPGISDDAPEAEQNWPRQTDVAERQRAVTLTRETLQNHPRLLKHVDAPNNLRWLSSGFQLVLGAGFFVMYQHAGVLRALATVGMHDRITELCGVSSGAIAGALYATRGPQGLTDCILRLSLTDFLDLSASKFYQEGALCAGKAVQDKISHDTGAFGCTRIEDAPGAKLRVAVFNGFDGKTEWRTAGPLGATVAQSAALPVLFANEGYFDGGWVDHHGVTALRPNKRAVSIRLNAKLEVDVIQKLVNRPQPLFDLSVDPEHKTVALHTSKLITPESFLFDIDWRKQKLVDIIQESEEMFRWWLYQAEHQRDFSFAA